MMWTIFPPNVTFFSAIGGSGQPGRALWPVFGASNQMLAPLTLAVLTLCLWQKNKPVAPLIIPTLFIMVVTHVALVLETGDSYHRNRPLLVIDLVPIVLMGWMIVEGISMVIRSRRRAEETTKGVGHG